MIGSPTPRLRAYAIHRADESSLINCPTSSAATPLAIPAVGTCKRDLRWTTIHLPARFMQERRRRSSPRTARNSASEANGIAFKTRA